MRRPLRPAVLRIAEVRVGDYIARDRYGLQVFRIVRVLPPVFVNSTARPALIVADENGRNTILLGSSQSGAVRLSA